MADTINPAFMPPEAWAKYAFPSSAAAFSQTKNPADIVKEEFSTLPPKVRPHVPNGSGNWALPERSPVE
jgi:hypothetical protein